VYMHLIRAMNKFSNLKSADNESEMRRIFRQHLILYSCSLVELFLITR
jgi:hypothetical protein